MGVYIDPTAPFKMYWFAYWFRALKSPYINTCRVNSNPPPPNPPPKKNTYAVLKPKFSPVTKWFFQKKWVGGGGGIELVTQLLEAPTSKANFPQKGTPYFLLLFVYNYLAFQLFSTKLDSLFPVYLGGGGSLSFPPQPCAAGREREREGIWRKGSALLGRAKHAEVSSVSCASTERKLAASNGADRDATHQPRGEVAEKFEARGAENGLDLPPAQFYSRRATNAVVKFV